MMTQKQNPTLDDVLNEFVAAYEQPSADALESWASRYPQFRKELVDFAAAWAEQLVLPPAPELSAEQEKRLVDRAMSHVQNVVFGREQSEAMQAEHRAITSLTGEAKRAGMSGQEFAKACGLDLALVTKLNRRQIKPLSIPARLVSHIARLLETTIEAVREYLALPPQALAGRAFLARGKPQSEGQQSFADAVRASSLGEAEKARWLDEAAGIDED
jgi:hypothetical protein